MAPTGASCGALSPSSSAAGGAQDPADVQEVMGAFVEGEAAGAQNGEQLAVAAGAGAVPGVVGHGGQGGGEGGGVGGEGRRHLGRGLLLVGVGLHGALVVP